MVSASLKTDLDIARDAYLALMQDVLLGRFAPANELVPVREDSSMKGRALHKMLSKRGAIRARWLTENIADVEAGHAWPRQATTMIGRPRLDNIRFCVENVLTNGVPGDVIETGVWKGGASIYMRAILKAWNVRDRMVWAADSYKGLPAPDLDTYAIDGTAYPYHEHNDVLGISLEEVKANFARVELLDDQVSFLKGWFKDTLPRLANQTWAVIRLDGDLYESTIQALTNLYPNLSPRGWLIVDDYNWVPVCKQAVTDYREQHGITEPIQEIDDAGVYWQRRTCQFDTP